jgi:hypothetical protein
MSYRNLKAPLDLKMINGLSLSTIPMGYSLDGTLDFVENLKIPKYGTQNPVTSLNALSGAVIVMRSQALVFASQEGRFTLFGVRCGVPLAVHRGATNTTAARVRPM